MASESSGHAAKLPFRCSTCGKRFKNHFFYVEHKNKFRYPHYYCRRCNLILPNAAQFYQHLDTPLETVFFEPGCGGVRCLRCNLHYETMLAFDSHFGETHPNGCKHCHLDFHNAIALQKHLDATHPSVNSNLVTSEPTIEFDTGHASGTALTENDGAPASESTEEVALEDTSSSTPPSTSTQGPGIPQKQAAAAESGLLNPGSNEPATPSLLENLLPDTTAATQHTLATTPPLGSGDCEEASSGSLLPLRNALDGNERAVADLAIQPPQVALHRNRIFGGRRRLYYCGKCNMGFPTTSELKQHLDHSTPLFERASTSDGGVRCFVCYTIFSTVDEFKSHAMVMDRNHQLLLAKWCIPCLLKFHTHTGLSKHNQAVHGCSPMQNDIQPPATAPPSERTPTAGTSSIPTQPAALEISVAETRAVEVAIAPRPIDLLFASLPLPPPLTSPEAPTVAPDMTEAVEVPRPQPHPLAPLEAMQPAARVGLSPSTTTSAASSVRPRPPFRHQSSQRPNSLYCRRCETAFSNHHEQKEHIRKGMSAIIPDENNEESLVCAQCKQSNRDIHAMKAHLQSHETTCIECLIYFHTPKGLQDHRESQHLTTSNGEGSSASEIPQSQASPITHPPSEQRPVSPPPEPTEQPAAPVPREVRPVIRGPQAVPRNHRTVRQISLQDFSDTDEDDPCDIDNSQLGGWQDSDPHGQRRPDADAYS
ncbi:hypothetical protein M407DRAFT_24606, partial [Tulasnella calospora MUT 4182]